MRRFSRLEFGEGCDEGVGKASAGEEVRDAEYFYNEACRYWLAGDFELALRNYSRSLEQNGAFFPCWLGQVEMLIELGEYKEANLWADKALEMFPENPELLAAKAVACVRDGKMEKAIVCSDASVAKNNVAARVWLARAEVLMERNSAIAQNCIGKAISVGGDGGVIRLQAGRLLNRKRDYAWAWELLRTACDEIPDAALAWYEIGLAQAGLGRPEAGVCFQRAIKLSPAWKAPRDALKKFEKRGFWRRVFGR